MTDKSTFIVPHYVFSRPVFSFLLVSSVPRTSSVFVPTVSTPPSTNIPFGLMSTNPGRNQFQSSSLQETETVIDEERAFQRYLRIVSGDKQDGSRRFELQTLVKTFETKLPPSHLSDDPMDIVEVDLHAQVHCADSVYFDYYNDKRKFAANYDRIHYELVTPRELLDQDEEGRRKVKEGCMLMPSPVDQHTALQYNLACQVDVVDFTQEKWFCSDYSREEFIEQRQLEKYGSDRSNNPALLGRRHASSSTLIESLPGAEMVQALVRPSTPATQDGLLETRLFSNLFLRGEGLASLMRALLWIVPVPEISVILLDWSSLSPRAGAISAVASSVVERLVLGDAATARKLVFAQMIVSGQANTGAESFIIGKRNDRAVQQLWSSITRDKCRANALVYGGLHCRDMERKLKEMGFTEKQTQWRTAWTIEISGDDGYNPPLSKSLIVGACAVPIYLAVSGLDWIATIQDIGNSIDQGHGVSAFLSAALYVARHVALYVGLAKFVVQWDVSLFAGTDGRKSTTVD